MDYRAALIEFYQKYNPDKLREVDLLLAKYRGREEELLHALKVKYGVHKTTPPTQQQPTVQPQSQSQTPTSKHQDPQQPPKEQEKKAEQSSTPKEESRQPEGSRTSERHEGYQSYGTDKGRTAAERAEYWKKELERRERERSGAAKPSSNKFTSKGKEEYEAELESEGDGEDEEDSSGISWFSVKRIVIIILMIVLIGGGVFVLLNDNMRTQISSLLGFAKTELPKQDKKSGIDPNEIKQTQDSTVNNPTGDFALDEEKDTEGEDASMNNQTNSRKKPPTEEEEYVPDKKRGDANPPREDKKVEGGLQTNYWYLSYITVSQEGAAKKAARELQAQGYDNAGYYYIPDYDPRGKRLYKVYIGPFSTVEAAERALDNNLRKVSPGTYPYLLK